VYTRINILNAFQKSHLQHTKRYITFPYMSHVHGTEKTQLEIIYKTVHRSRRLRHIRPTGNEFIYSS